MTPSPNLTQFLMAWEGPPHLTPREDACAPGVWDVGYGCVVDQDFPALVSLQAAEDLLRIKINEAARIVDDAVTVPLAQHEFDALVSFTYNLGGKHFRESTLLRKVNDSNFEGAELEFGKWTHAGGKVIAGLVKRRTAELAMFKDGDYSKRP